MSLTHLEPGGEVADALARACRTRTPGVLSDPQALGDALGGFAIAHPAEAGLIVSAAEVDVAGMLTSHLGADLDLETAVHLTSTALEVLRSIDAQASRWATIEFARALGYDVSALTPGAAAGATTGADPAAGSARPAPPARADRTGSSTDTAPPFGGEPAASGPTARAAAWAGLLANERAATAAQREQMEEIRERTRHDAQERARLAAQPVAAEAASTATAKARKPVRTRFRGASRYTNSGKPLWMVVLAAVITYLLMAAYQGLPPFPPKSHTPHPTPTTTTVVPPGGGPASLATTGGLHGAPGASQLVHFAGSGGVSWYPPASSSAVSSYGRHAALSGMPGCRSFWPR